MSVAFGLAYMLLVQLLCGTTQNAIIIGNNYLAPFVNNFLNQSFYGQFGVVLDNSGLGVLFGAVTSAQYLGNILGILSFAYIVDNIGRRNAITVVHNAILIPACIMQAVAQPLGAWEFYLIGRLLLGFSTSVASAAPLFIGECAPDHLRGAAIIFTMCGGNLWIVAGNFLAQPGAFGTQERWNYYFLFPVPVFLLHFTLGFTLHKSPKYLFIVRHDQVSAKKSLSFYHGPHVDFDNQFEHYMNEAALTPAPNSTKLSTIWATPHLRKALLLCICLSLYTVYSGDAVLLQYANYVFQKFGLDQSGSLYVMLAIYVLAALFIVLAAFLIIERFRRRTLVFVGHGITMLMSVSLCIAFALGDNNLISYGCLILSVLCMVILLSMGGGTVGNVFFAELTPQIVRAKITQICLLCRYSGEFAATLIFPALFSIGNGYTFLCFVVVTVFVVVWLFRNLPESRNRPADEIVGDMLEEENLVAELRHARSGDFYGSLGGAGVSS